MEKPMPWDDPVLLGYLKTDFLMEQHAGTIAMSCDNLLTLRELDEIINVSRFPGGKVLCPYSGQIYLCPLEDRVICDKLSCEKWLDHMAGGGE